MADCVIYARVSTKEQQDEGYSIPAQLKAAEGFCVREGLKVVKVFQEADSASKPGRSVFAEMVAYFVTHPDVRLLVVHKLDRLTRNWDDKTAIENLGVRVRCVEGDIPDTPEGHLLGDFQQAMAVYYSRNLSREVKKGFQEKVEQGGFPHKAPLGYLNDVATRSLVVDSDTAPLVKHAFDSYSTGLVSLADLCSELNDMGLRTRGGNKLYVSALHLILTNPIYMGLVRHNGEVYPGAHKAIVYRSTFERVQETLRGNGKKNGGHTHTFVLRDFLLCDECGCKITAGLAKKTYTYYRCTHGKGKDSCSQRSYTREEALVAEVEDVLSRISIGHDTVAAIAADVRKLAERDGGLQAKERADAERQRAAARSRGKMLLAKLLDRVITDETYQQAKAELDEHERGLELRIADLQKPRLPGTPQVEKLAEKACGADVRFTLADDQRKRGILSDLLWNLNVKDGHIVSYQYKDPFRLLERTPEGAYVHEWSG